MAGDFGTDHVLLSGKAIEAKIDGICLKGTAACVQDHRGEVVLSLGTAGEVGYRDITLTSSGAASIAWSDKKSIRLELPKDHPGMQFRLKLPGAYRPDDPKLDAKSNSKGELEINIPAGIASADLIAN